MSSRIALVMGSGGTQGSMWMRVILDELKAATGFDRRHAHTIIGTSAGAVVGSEADTRLDPPESVVAALAALAQPLPKLRPNPSAFWLRRVLGHAVAVASFRGKHDPRDWAKTVPRHDGLRTVTTTALGNRRVASPTGGLGADEIAASAAVPFWDHPVRIDGQRLSDGAIWSATNADLIDPADFDLLMLFAPHVTLESKTLSFTGLHRIQLERELRPWRASGKPCLWFIPTLESYEHRQDHERHQRDAKALADATLA